MRDKAEGLTAERPGPEEGGLGGSGEGVLFPRGKGARSGVGGGLKREGRGAEGLQPEAEGPGGSGDASRGLTREGLEAEKWREFGVRA